MQCTHSVYMWVALKWELTLSWDTRFNLVHSIKYTIFISHHLSNILIIQHLLIQLTITINHSRPPPPPTTTITGDHHHIWQSLKKITTNKHKITHGKQKITTEKHQITTRKWKTSTRKWKSLLQKQNHDTMFNHLSQPPTNHWIKSILQLTMTITFSYMFFLVSNSYMLNKKSPLRKEIDTSPSSADTPTWFPPMTHFWWDRAFCTDSPAS